MVTYRPQFEGAHSNLPGTNLKIATSLVAGSVRSVWWDRLWVPIANDGMGNTLCLDLAPPTQGNRGQVIEYVHDYEVRSVVSFSFRAWLSTYAAELENGRYQVDDFSGYPVRKR